jgi:hypothetical protein
MRHRSNPVRIPLVALVFGAVAFSLSALAEEDNSSGLPDDYAKDYLVASETLSPDGNFVIIYPKEDTDNAKNYLVALHPFAVLGALDTKWPYFKNENHGGLSAKWSDDGAVALVTLDGKWGPRDIFVLELRDNKLARATNLLRKMHDLLLPSFRKAKASPYNDVFDFIFDTEEAPACILQDAKQVLIDAHATTNPKGGEGRVWTAHLVATWDIAQARFTSQKVTR